MRAAKIKIRYESVLLLMFSGFCCCFFFSDARSSELIHFIVDSGSDVVTVSESLIAELQLEYLRNVESRGAHAAVDKPLYNGVIKLGTEEFHVEVG